MALDRGESGAAIHMDCLPHELMLAKLKNHGLSNEAENYLSGRMQQVRVGSHTSSWKNLSKGVPQSIYFRIPSF